MNAAAAGARAAGVSVTGLNMSQGSGDGSQGLWLALIICYYKA